MTTQAFRTKQEAEDYALQLRDAKRDPQTGYIWARDPIHHALGKAYITQCIAFTKSGKRVAAYTVTIGA
jgi:hypothetical protein